MEKEFNPIIANLKDYQKFKWYFLNYKIISGNRTVFRKEKKKHPQNILKVIHKNNLAYIYEVISTALKFKKTQVFMMLRPSILNTAQLKSVIIWQVNILHLFHNKVLLLWNGEIPGHYQQKL